MQTKDFFTYLMGALQVKRRMYLFLSHSNLVVGAFRLCPHHRCCMLLLPLLGDQGEEEQYLKGEDTGKRKGREEERTSFLFPSPLIIVECVVESVRRCNGREKKNKN